MANSISHRSRARVQRRAPRSCAWLVASAAKRTKHAKSIVFARVILYDFLAS